MARSDCVGDTHGRCINGESDVEQRKKRKGRQRLNGHVGGKRGTRYSKIV